MEPTIIVVNKGERIPCAGKAVEGFAFVDEAAFTGVSSAAMIDADRGRNQVIEGGTILDGWLKIECAEAKEKAPSPPPLSQPVNAIPRSCDYFPADYPSSISRGTRVLLILLFALAAAAVFALIGYASMHSAAASSLTGVVGLVAGSLLGSTTFPPLS
jgi:high-affinity K+ transport system ATPase subunit B